ncbi:MAG: sodium/solute symporter [Verrucomicrobiae bacterium]|nr:sodium/solute symporter [Verrucomicrobiae bacterium]
MHPLDYAAVGLYLAVTVGLGVAFGRHQSRREFFAASGAMGWLTVGLSVMATLFSSNSFVFFPSAAYSGSLRMGMSLVAFSLMTPVVVYIFIPVFTRMKCETAYEYLERRYHVSVRCLASGLFVLLRIGWMAAATYAAALVVAKVANVPQTGVILTLGAVAILYTMLGGLRAVMWTDVVQFFVFTFTILIALWLVISKTGLGAGEIASRYAADRTDVLFDFSPCLTLAYGSWGLLLGSFLEGVSAFGADQVAVQRYLSARTERTAQTGAWLNLLGMWIVMPGLLAIGAGLAVYYAGQGKMVAADEALPTFVRFHFPPGMTGLFLAALLAAIMSSIDSGIHSVTTALVVDFRDRLLPQWKPDNDADDVRLIRTLVVLVGAVSVGLACFVGPLGNVFDIAKKTTAAFGGPLLAVFVLALFFPRSSVAGVFLGALAGAAITFWLTFAKADWFSMWFWPAGFGLAMGIGLVTSVLTRRREASALTWRGIVGQARRTDTAS